MEMYMSGLCVCEVEQSKLFERQGSSGFHRVVGLPLTMPPPYHPRRRKRKRRKYHIIKYKKKENTVIYFTNYTMQRILIKCLLIGV